MKKRLLTIILTVTVLGVCGCSDKKENNTENSAEKVSVTEERTQSEPSVVEETPEPTLPPFSEDDVDAIEVTSTDLHDGVWDTVITNTNNGSNVSPQLSWEDYKIVLE